MAVNTRVWEAVSPDEARVPREAIERFTNKLKEERVLLHGFAMLDNGRLAAEQYYGAFNRDSLHRMFSVGKSFVSLAIGLLQEEGKLSLDDCICRYFPEKCKVLEESVMRSHETLGGEMPCVGMRYAGDGASGVSGAGSRGIHPWVAQLTIRQMLSMTTCHAKTTYKVCDGDWVESFFKVKPTNLPGAVFAYDTSSSHVLSALVEKLSGQKLMDYLRSRAFDKIGVSGEAYYMPDPFGISQGGSGLNCTLRDVLAVAELVMNEGVYGGEQLLPKDYLKEATSFKISTLQQPSYDEQLGYGYQIWRGRHNCFYFYGIGGQLAVCLPGEKFILVTMGNTLENKNGVKDIFDAFFEEIYPYLVRKEGEDTMEGRTEPGAAVSHSAFRNNHTYHFKSNMLDISRLQLSLKEGEGKLRLAKEGREFELTFGTEEYQPGRFPWSGAECHCKGEWVMENMFFIRCHILGPEMANIYICIRFTRGGVTVKMTKGADDAMKNFEGVASGMAE